MIYVREEGACVRNGFNFYPRRGGIIGFLFVWGKFCFACYRYKRSQRWVIGRLFC